MKKIYSLAMLLMMGLAFTACGSDDDKDTPDNVDTDFNIVNTTPLVDQDTYPSNTTEANYSNKTYGQQAIGDYHGNVLFMEQYVERTKDAIEGSISREYDCGYYYWFPSTDHDVVGYGDKRLTLAMFRDILARFGVEETKIKGAYIPVEEVESGSDRIILIGDAGGFPNKLTYEGLYYAIVTGRNASTAIIEGRPFSETNRIIFKKKRKERFITNIFYNSPWGMLIVRLCSHSTRLVKRIFDAGV